MAGEPFVPGPFDVIMPGALKEQFDVPFKYGTSGEVLGRAHVLSDGRINIELNEAGTKLLEDKTEYAVYPYSIHGTYEKDTSMREYAVVSINRQFEPEYFVMFMDKTDIMWTSHSGPYSTGAIAEEVADALTIKARSDAGTL
jgi:hypothetical protein